MKKGLLLGCLLFSGCSLFSSGPDKTFVRTTRTYYEISSRELKRYIQEDQTLDEIDRRRRMELIDEYRKVLEEVER